MAFILVYDQDARVRAIGREYLCLVGHKVVEVPSYDDLLDCSLENVPDAVFVGTESVGTKSDEIVSRVRRMYPHVPVIFTSCDDREAMQITWSDVPNAFLVKPCEFKTLGELVATLVLSGGR